MTNGEQVAKILADILGGCPLVDPCNKIWALEGWCKDHCKPGQQEPDSECWLKYAEAMVNEAENSNKSSLTQNTLDVPDTNVDDTISRQAAIDALMDEFKRVPTTAIRAKNRIDRLPSAQPNLQPACNKLATNLQQSCNHLATDTISKRAAIDAIVNTVSEIGLHDNSEVARYGATFRQHEIIDIIEGVPSAQPERNKGEWVGAEFDGYADGNPVYYEWKCSACGCVVEDEEPAWNYCPNCGTDMRGEQDG